MARSLDLNSMRSFSAVAEAGSFTAAAQRLGIPKARVSVDIRRLEKQLATALFTRTTRRVALTDAGRTLQTECVPLLRRIEATAIALRSDQNQLAGRLRITSTVDHAANCVAQAAADFASAHPELQIELITSDRKIDLVQEGIDVAIRMGWLRDSTVRAVKLTSFEQYVVASPAYLTRADYPKRPEELAGHSWIALTQLASPLTWKFLARDGASRVVRVQARLRTDTASTLRSLLESGAGVSVLDSLSSAQSVLAGRLVRILSGWSLPKGGIHAVFPPGEHISPQARAFVDFYRKALTATSTTRPGPRI